MIEFIIDIAVDLLKENTGLGQQLTKSYEELKSNPWIKRLIKVQKIAGQVQNPSSFVSGFLRNLTPLQLQSFNKELSKVIRHVNFQKVYIQKLKSSANKFKNEQVEEFLNQVKQRTSIKEAERLKDVDIRINLVSSWIRAGLFIPVYERAGDFFGNLHLNLKSGSYIYFNVPYHVWEKMVHGPYDSSKPENIAKGSQSAAGTVFWREYLDNYTSFGGKGKTRAATRKKRLNEVQKIINRNINRSGVGLYRKDYNIPKTFKKAKRFKSVRSA